LGTHDYDAYRLIRFQTDRALWSDTTSPWRLHAFHTGWLYGDPVTQQTLHGDRSGQPGLMLRLLGAFAHRTGQ